MPKRRNKTSKKRKKQRLTSQQKRIRELEQNLFNLAETLNKNLSKDNHRNEQNSGTSSDSDSSQSSSDSFQNKRDRQKKHNSGRVFFNIRFNNANKKPISNKAYEFIFANDMHKIIQEHDFEEAILLHRAALQNWANGRPDVVSIMLTLPLPSPSTTKTEEEEKASGTNQQTSEEATSAPDTFEEVIPFYRLPFRQCATLPTKDDYGKHLKYFLTIHHKEQILWCPPTAN